MNVKKIRVNSYMYIMTTIVVKSDKGIDEFCSIIFYFFYLTSLNTKNPYGAGTRALVFEQKILNRA